MKTKIIFDPLNKFDNASEQDIIQACGYIPGWTVNKDYSDDSLKDALDKQYGFGLFEDNIARVDEEGKYIYPGDQDFYPLIKITRNEEILYQYQYGLVAIIDKEGNSFCTRMD